MARTVCPVAEASAKTWRPNSSESNSHRALGGQPTTTIRPSVASSSGERADVVARRSRGSELFLEGEPGGFLGLQAERRCRRRQFYRRRGVHIQVQTNAPFVACVHRHQQRSVF